MKRLIILTFDIPRDKAYTRVKIWRKLKEIGARLRMRSHWGLSFSKVNLRYMKRIAKEIKRSGGKAEIIVGEKVM